MSESKRYKKGDVFKATLVITGVYEDDDDGPIYDLTIKELNDSVLDISYTQDDLDLAFNPAIIKRKLQNDLDRITKQLEEMNNNDT